MGNGKNSNSDKHGHDDGWADKKGQYDKDKQRGGRKYGEGEEMWRPAPWPEPPPPKPRDKGDKD